MSQKNKNLIYIEAEAYKQANSGYCHEKLYKRYLPWRWEAGGGGD